jgi:hypothetical protein
MRIPASHVVERPVRVDDRVLEEAIRVDVGEQTRHLAFLLSLFPAGGCAWVRWAVAGTGQHHDDPGGVWRRGQARSGVMAQYSEEGCAV